MENTKIFCPECGKEIDNTLKCGCGYEIKLDKTHLERLILKQQTILLQNVIDKVEYVGKEKMWTYKTAEGETKWQLGCWRHDVGREIRYALVNAINPMHKCLKEAK